MENKPLSSRGILYLHGFRSSPASWKARLLAEAVEARRAPFLCPALSHDPRQAIAQAEALIEAAGRAGEGGTKLCLVGSSLGGFYATYLAEKYALKAVLINPAVLAGIVLEPYLGVQENLYTGESFEFTREHIECLRRLQVDRPGADRYLLLVETGDELLDYRQAVAHYRGCRQQVLTGGDHSFTRFAESIPQIVEFAEI